MVEEYKRLLAWAMETNRDLGVSESVSGWTIKIEINSPVRFRAYGSGAELDEAAVVVTKHLESVSGGPLEEIPEDPTPFGTFTSGLRRRRSLADSAPSL
jgi:hypothetical protein